MQRQQQQTNKRKVKKNVFIHEKLNVYALVNITSTQWRPTNAKKEDRCVRCIRLKYPYNCEHAREPGNDYQKQYFFLFFVLRIVFVAFSCHTNYLFKSNWVRQADICKVKRLTGKKKTKKMHYSRKTRAEKLWGPASGIWESRPRDTLCNQRKYVKY